MGMMYHIIAQALEKVGLSEAYHPQDFLNFYCLGKRETSSPDTSPQVDLSSTHENRSLVCSTMSMSMCSSGIS